MYSLLVSHELTDWNEGPLSFSRDRFLEYTSDHIVKQLKSASLEAIECIKSWPCLLIAEGRTEQVARVARIVSISPSSSTILISLEINQSIEPFVNADLWRLRESLDIEQFEFNRGHWSIKERDLYSILEEAGVKFLSEPRERTPELALPTPTRAAIISASSVIASWSHSEIDSFLLEAGVAALNAGRNLGGRQDRANAIIEYSIDNLGAVTAENSLLSVLILKRTKNQQVETNPAEVSIRENKVGLSISTESRVRVPNRVFVVHGRNEVARSQVVSFLEGMGLEGVVLHELTLPPKTGSLNEHINMFVKGIKNEATTTRSIYDRV